MTKHPVITKTAAGEVVTVHLAENAGTGKRSLPEIVYLSSLLQPEIAYLSNLLQESVAEVRLDESGVQLLDQVLESLPGDTGIGVLDQALGQHAELATFRAALKDFRERDRFAALLVNPAEPEISQGQSTTRVLFKQPG